MLVPPKSRTETVVDVLHGVEVRDPYRWLEDQESPETRRWIEAQNNYTDLVLARMTEKAALDRRFAELLQTEVADLPLVRGDLYFYTKRKADQDLKVLYVRRRGEEGEKVLLDPHTWSEDLALSMVLLDVSARGDRLAFAVRDGGEDEIVIRVMETATGRILDSLPRGLYYGVSLSADGGTLYYTLRDGDGPRVWRHRLGADRGADDLLFGDGFGPDKIILPELSSDGRLLVLNVLHGSSAHLSEVHLIDFDRGDEPRPVVDDLNARFYGRAEGGRLYLLTNWLAPHSRLLAISPERLERSAWRELIPERRDSVLEDFALIAGQVVASYLRNVVSRIVTYDLDGRTAHEFDFELPGTVEGMAGSWSGSEGFFSFSSFPVPPSICRYDAESGRRESWHRSEVPIDPERLVVRQEWLTSRDGTRLPVFLVHDKDLPRDGSHPTLLTGYGGFNVNLTPGFSATAAVWVEQGGVYAVANLRGGGEFGERWHAEGILERKQNVFDDFTAVARWLMDEGYTRPEKLAVSGSSNGGLLVATLLTQHPEMVRAVICSYPLLDMLRYHRFLVAPYWVAEYGSADDPDLFPVLLSYSPYHNVESEAPYPAVLFITGDGDTRVAPLHARKMAARLQAATARAPGSSGPQRPVLLRYHTRAGHSGDLPVSERIGNLSESLAFLLWQLGEL